MRPGLLDYSLDRVSGPCQSQVIVLVAILLAALRQEMRDKTCDDIRRGAVLILVVNGGLCCNQNQFKRIHDPFLK
jgi:hypothetical protein